MSTIPGLARALDQQRAIGRSVIFYAVEDDGYDTPVYWDGTAALFLAQLGDTEGEVVFTPNETYNVLTAPELTGDAPLEAYRQGSAPVLTVPMVYADPGKRELISSTGNASDGYDRQRPVELRTVVVFPEELFYNSTTKSHDLTLDWSTGSFTLAGSALTGRKAELLGMSAWIWRLHIRNPQFRFRHEEGGKSVEPVEIVVMVDKDKPNGHLLYTIGSPFAASIAIDGGGS